jgi:hypothetical protein
VLRLWHLTSLDAPTVAVVWSCGFAWAAGIPLPVWAPVLLALVAWSVYIGDRLLDAQAGLRTPPLHHLRERHYFHWRHRLMLVSAALCAAGASAWMIFTLLPAGARVPDSAIGAATLAYFSGVHAQRRLPRVATRFLRPLFSKEFLVGVLFTMGCLLPVWSQSVLRAGHAAWRVLLLPGLFFMGLAWLNCHAIESWESADYEAGSERVARTACGVGLAGVVLAGILVFRMPHAAALIATGAMSAWLLAGLDLNRQRITPLALRASADLVLLAPLLLIPIGLVWQ